MKKRKRIALALGGGGARGLAHLGVLKVFEEHQVPIDVIVGCSMGSIIGAAYALEPDTAAIRKKVEKLLHDESIQRLEALAEDDTSKQKYILLESLSDFVSGLLQWNVSGIKGWLIDKEPILNIIKILVDDASFDDLKIDFVCVASDLNTGKEVVLSEGSLPEAVFASAAIPGVFPPLDYNNTKLIDGGYVTLLPADVARNLGADTVIGVNVDKNLSPKEFKHGFDIIFRADEIRRSALNLRDIEHTDLVIEPAVGDISWARFSKAADIIAAGEKAAREALPRLAELIKA